MKSILLITILSFSIFQLTAQSFEWKEKERNGYYYQYVENDPANARFYVLQNGLTVILSENHSTPRIQTIIGTKAGSKSDPAEHTGLAHYLEHMLFKGTDKYGSLNWEKEKVLLNVIDDLYEQYNSTKDETQRKEIYKEIDSVSGEASKYAIANEYDKLSAMIGAKGTNAFTSFEKTAYINDIPTNQIDRWLAIEAERFRNPILRIFHTELEAVYEEKNRSLDSDGDKVFEKLFLDLFPNHNYGLQTTIGTIEHLKNPSLKEIRNYFQTYYVPNNMCLIMVGDFDADEVIGKVDKAFAYMQAKDVPQYTFSPEKEITKPKESTIYGPDAEYLTMAYRFPGADSKEAMLLDVMGDVLSNGTAGLMDLNLVKKQKVLSAGGGAYVLKDYGTLYLEGKAKQGQQLEEVKALMLGEIEKLKRGDFDNSLLQAVLNNNKKYNIQRYEGNGGRAYSLLDAFIVESDWRQEASLLEKMSSITKNDIQQFAQKWLRDNYVCVYKKIGKDPNALKVDKPTITPVSVNRDAQSDFVTQIANTKTKEIKPVYLNYEKDIDRAEIMTGKRITQLLAVKNTTNDLFNQYYYIPMGSHHNKVLPIAMDYLQFLGTKKLRASEISKKFYTLACDFGVSASSEESYVYLNGLQENYTEALKLFEELLAQCQPDENALKEMIAGIKKKRTDAKRSKGAIRSGMRYYAMYGADNPFNYELSNEELDELKAQDLVNMIHNLLGYSHKVLYYGPKSANQLSRVLSQYHGTFRPEKRIPEIHKFVYQKQQKNQVLMTDYDMVQSEISWIRINDQFSPEVLPSIKMFNEYFGGNMSGIVFQDIRESKALAYSAYASYGVPSQEKDPFYMMGYVGCQADKMKESITAMQALLDKLPLSEKLFANSKASLLNSISTSRINKASILFDYLSAQKKGVNYDLRKNTFDKVSNMQLTDVKDFHENEIANKAHTLSVLGSKEKLDMDVLKNYGSVKELSLVEIFGY
jgi:predicted Zn-dependent peptidase